MTAEAATVTPRGTELLARLHDIVGAERLITTDDARRLRALDFSEEPGAVPLAVTVKVAAVPRRTLWLAGFVTIIGSAGALVMRVMKWLQFQYCPGSVWSLHNGSIAGQFVPIQVTQAAVCHSLCPMM